MAYKRKSLEGIDIAPRKKTRAVDSQDTPDLDWSSDDSGDYKVNYTDNGTRRAESEARRQWNYICEVGGCGQRFNRPCRLEAHMRSHTKERPFACPEAGCNKTFPRKDHLQRHLKNAHSDGNSERTFICDWEGCGKSFTSNGRLQRHKDVHESKYYCTGYPPCSESFRKENALEAHIKTQHLDAKLYPCTHVDEETGERCTHGYQTAGALRRHVSKVHAGAQENGHLCMICVPPGTEVESIETESGETITIPKEPLSFASNEELLAHAHEYHPPICSQCDIKFKNQQNLRSHYDTVHADRASQPQFPCPKPGCKSVFNRKHNLNVHIQTVHEKQFRYNCVSDAMQASKHDDLKAWNGTNACGAAFKAKSSLDQHIRTHHLGLGNRKQARKAAKSKKKPEPSTLTLLTGVGYDEGRDVPCLVDNCEYRFYMDRDLRRHLLSMHRIPEEDIEDMIRERDALAGGQFWVGGLDETNRFFEATESIVQPSVPQTPHPYFSSQNMQIPPALDGNGKPIDPQLGLFDQQFDHLSLFNEEAEMDLAMGLGELPPAVDAQEGLQWDMLAPVEQYNFDTINTAN